MIVAEQKPVAEIKEMMAPFRKILLVGCGTCVKTCMAGGDVEAAILASALKMAMRGAGRDLEVEELTVERQCEEAFLEEIDKAAANAEAILSLGCGAGVQAIAERFPNLPIFPGLNTTFLGILQEVGLWTEKCAGCGDCRLHEFGGLCPVARCSKRLFNGPCGGSKEGKCEVNPETACVWQAIYDRLQARRELYKLEEIVPPKNWQAGGYGGPRKLERKDHVI